MTFRRKSERKTVVFIFLAGICYSAMMIVATLFFSFSSHDAPNRYVFWRSQTMRHKHFSPFIMWRYLYALAHEWVKRWSLMRSSSLKSITALLNPAVLYQLALLSLPLTSVYQWAVMHKYTSDSQKDATKNNVEGFFPPWLPVMMASSMSNQLIRSKASCLQLEEEKLIQMTESDISASVNHLRIRPLTSA